LVPGFGRAKLVRGRINVNLDPGFAAVVRSEDYHVFLCRRMLRYGMQFVDRGAEFYEAQHRTLQINYLKRKAASLGFQIFEAPAA
jgi:hypothetical protein